MSAICIASREGNQVLKRAGIGATIAAVALASLSTGAGASNRSQASAWANRNNAGPIARKVVQDADSYVNAANAASTNKLLKACHNLSRDLPAAQDLPRIPVASFESLWSRGLADLSKGASQCLAAYTARDEQRPSRARSLAEASAHSVNAGVSLLQKLSTEA